MQFKKEFKRKSPTKTEVQVENVKRTTIQLEMGINLQTHKQGTNWERDWETQHEQDNNPMRTEQNLHIKYRNK